MTRIGVFLTLFLVVLGLSPILLCESQSSDLKVVAEPYQWDADMKRLSTTTPERGLTFKITFSNTATEAIELYKLYINVRVETESRPWSFYEQLQVNDLYLPPNECYHRFVEVDFGGGSAIGSYSAELTYGSYVGENIPIERYPFDFDVVSEEEFQRRLEETPQNLTINIYITLIGVGGIGVGSITLIGVFFYKRRRPQKSTDRLTIIGTIVILFGIVWTVITSFM